MPGVYFHIPFCKNKCSYCDFYSVATTTYLEPILLKMQNELNDNNLFFENNKITSIYIGGGTPSLLDVQQVEFLFDELSKYCDLSQLNEVTFEANPEDMTLDYLKHLRKSTPINRLSMGVQSFSDEILTFMRRRHDSSRAKQAFFDAREAGFDNISLDLIYGVPGMSEGQWHDSVGQMIELSPEHISAYHLSIEPQTRFGMMMKRGEIKPVDEKVSEENYDFLCKSLSGAGYEHYEISNFAKPGCRAIHNSSYWRGEPYLGIGPGAHSFDGKKRHWCEQNVKEYLQNIEYESEILTSEDKYNEFIMLGFRQKDGVNVVMLEKLYGKDKKDEFLKISKNMLTEGLMTVYDGFYRISESNWLISDNIISRFFV